MSDRKHIILGVGAVVFHDNRILLVKRKKAPYLHQWSIPGGTVRFGESLRDAAVREIREETGIIIEAGEPVYTFEVIDELKSHYVVIDLEARYISGTPKASDDAEDAAWFDADMLADVDVNPITRDLLTTKYRFIK